MKVKNILSFLIIALFSISLVSAVWWNPFSWGTDGIVEKNGNWYLDHLDGIQLEYFNTEIQNLDNGKAKICLLPKTDLRISNDIIQQSKATLKLNNIETRIVQPSDMETESEGGNIKKMCVDVDVLNEDTIKFGENSAQFIYTSESITAYEDIAFFNDEYVEIGKLSLSTEGYDYKNGKPNLQTGFGDNLLTHTFYIENYSTNSITNLRTVDLNNNGVELERNVNLKFLSYIEVEEPTYENVCNDIINGTNVSQVCENVVNGTEWVLREQWNDMGLSVEGENYIIGVFADVKNKDYVDVDFDYYGISVLESPIDWATWTASLKTGLITYQDFNDDVLDDYGNYNGTTSGDWAYITGKIGKGGNATLTGYVNTTYSASAQPLTINFWMNPVSSTGNNQEVWRGNANFKLLMDAGSGNIYCYDGSHRDMTNKMSVGSWSMYSFLVYDTSNVVSLYINGSYVRNVTCADSAIVNMGYASNAGVNSIRGGIDELSVHGRILSSAEISEIWNSGAGLALSTADASPQVTLTSPANNSNLTSSSQDFVGVVTDDLYVENVSLKIDGVIVETDTSHTNGTYNFNAITITEGYHNWSILAYDNASQSNESEVWFFNYTQPPVFIELLSPANGITSNNITLNISCFGYKDTGVTQLNMTIDGVLNQTVTNSTPSENLTISELIDFSEGEHNWSCSVTDGMALATSSTRTFTIDTTPLIDFLTPPTLVNYANISQEFIPMKVNVTTLYFQNITYSLRDVNGTNYTQFYTNETYDINFTDMADAHYHYDVTVCTTTGECNVTEERHINHDNTPPTINITSPSLLNDLGENGLNVTFTANFSDIHLDSCWYNYNGTNITFPCTNNQFNSTSFGISNYDTDIVFYANDTFGLLLREDFDWNYKVFENSLTYSTTTISGAGEQFKTNITYNTYYSGISVLLNYNGTNYTMSSLGSGFTKEYYYNLTIPNVVSEQNITVYFIYLLSNTTDSTTVFSDSFNQTVSPFLIDDCSSYNETLLDFYMVDEDTLTEINGTIEVNVNIYSYGTTDLVNSFNASFDYLTTTDSKVCLENITQDYTMSYQIKHYGNVDQYFQKYRNIQRMTINGETVPQNITLYNLNLSRGYAFSVIVVGNLLSSVGNRGLLVDAQRQYLSLDEFKSIETSITNADGTAVSHLVPTSEIYNFIISYNGEVLGTFNNYQVQCSNAPLGQCSITLNLAQATGTAPDFENYGNISQIFLLNQDTHILYNTFSSTDGTSKTVRSLVIKLDGYGNTTICNSSSTGTSGTLTCEIPVIYQNSTFYVQTFVDGDLLGTKTLSQGVDQEWYGVDTIIILLAFSSFVLLFVGHPITIVLGAVLGLIFPVILVSIAGLSFITIMGSLLYWVAGGVLIWIVIRRKM